MAQDATNPSENESTAPENPGSPSPAAPEESTGAGSESSAAETPDSASDASPAGETAVEAAGVDQPAAEGVAAEPGTTPDSPAEASAEGADPQSADAPSEASADDASGETSEVDVSQAELDALLAETGMTFDEDDASQTAGEDAAVAVDSDSGADAAADGVVYVPPEVVNRSDSGDEGRSIEILNDVSLDVSVELGRTQMRVEDVLQLGPGSVVELDKLAGDPVEIFVNERLIARGEVLVLNDDFCVRVSEIVSPVEERAQG